MDNNENIISDLNGGEDEPRRTRQNSLDVLERCKKWLGTRTCGRLAYSNQNGDVVRIKKEIEECLRCGKPFASDPYEDWNSEECCWSYLDQTFYCYQCYLDFFFNFYIDLSLNDPEVADLAAVKWQISNLWCMRLECEISSYTPKIDARGFEKVATIESDFNLVRRVCGEIARNSKRYLVLVESVDPAIYSERHHIFQTNKDQAHGFPEFGYQMAKIGDISSLNPY